MEKHFGMITDVESGKYVISINVSAPSYWKAREQAAKYCLTLKNSVRFWFFNSRAERDLCAKERTQVFGKI